jgi:hypothetical protein
VTLLERKYATRGRVGLQLGWLTAFLSGTLVLATPVAAISQQGSGALLLGISAGVATRDLLSVTDVRPASRGETVAEVELAYHVKDSWAVAVGARFGGSWFDFQQDLVFSTGNIKDQDLVVRGALDHVLSLAPLASAHIGIGVEYGQARSFTSTRFFDEEGPRTYYLGGLMRAGCSYAILPRLQIQAEVSQSVFRAHARHASLASEYHWLGRSLSMTLGFRTVLIRGRVP